MAARCVEDGRDDDGRSLARTGRPDDQHRVLGTGVDGGDGAKAVLGDGILPLGVLADRAAPPGTSGGARRHQGWRRRVGGVGAGVPVALPFPLRIIVPSRAQAPVRARASDGARSARISAATAS